MVRCPNCRITGKPVADGIPEPSDHHPSSEEPALALGLADLDDASELLSMLADAPDVMASSPPPPQPAFQPARRSPEENRALRPAVNQQRGPVIMRNGQQLRSQSLREIEAVPKSAAPVPVPDPVPVPLRQPAAHVAASTPEQPVSTAETKPREPSLSPPPDRGVSTQPTLQIQCECGAAYRVSQMARPGRKRCRRCGATILVPGRKPQTSTPAAQPLSGLNLQDTIEQSLNLPGPTREDQSERSDRKKMSSRARARLEEQLTVTNPLSETEAQARRKAILEAGQAGHTAASSVIARCVGDEFPFVRQAVATALTELKSTDALSAVLPLLADPDADVVREATKCLRKIGDPRAILPLILLGPVRPEFALQSLDAAVHIGQSHPATLISLAASEDRRVQADAAFALGKIKAPAAIPILTSLLTDSTDSTVRARAADALGRIGDPNCVPTLMRLLQEDDAVLRLAAVIAFQNFSDVRPVQSLLPLLRSTDGTLRRQTVKALAATGDSRCVPEIARLVDDPQLDEATQAEVATALGASEHPAGTAALASLLGSSHDSVILKASASIRKLRLHELAPQIARLTEAANPAVRRHAAETLGELDDPASLTTLCGLVASDSSFEVRAASAKALGRLGDSSALPALENALKDEVAVRCAAVIALGELHDPSAQPALMAMLRDSAAEVRYHATMGLAKIGAKNAQAAIAALLSDPEPLVKNGAQKALELLGVEKAPPTLGGRFRSVAGGVVPDWAASFLPRSPLRAGMLASAVVLVGTLVFLTVSVTAAPRILLRGNVSDIRFSPDGQQLLVTRMRGAAEVWDLASASIVSDVPVSSGSFGAFVGDATQAVLLSNGKAMPWQTGGANQIDEEAAWRICPTMKWAAFPTDGSFGVCLGEASALSWDTKTGEQIAKFAVSPIARCGMNATGTVFVEALEGVLKFGNPRAGQLESREITLPEGAGNVGAVAVSQDGNRVALCMTSQQLVLVQLDTGRTEIIPAQTGRAAAFGPDGTLWFVQSNTLSLLDPKSDEVRSVVLDDLDRIDSLTVSPDGTTVCVGSSENDQVWVLAAATMTTTSVLSPPAPQQ